MGSAIARADVDVRVFQHAGNFLVRIVPHARGNEVCVERSTGEHGCAPIQENLELGASWEGENAATGETVTYTIVARE